MSLEMVTTRYPECNYVRHVIYFTRPFQTTKYQLNRHLRHKYRLTYSPASPFQNTTTLAPNSKSPLLSTVFIPNHTWLNLIPPSQLTSPTTNLLPSAPHLVFFNIYGIQKYQDRSSQLRRIRRKYKETVNGLDFLLVTLRLWSCLCGFSEDKVFFFRSEFGYRDFGG